MGSGPLVVSAWILSRGYQISVDSMVIWGDDGRNNRNNQPSYVTVCDVLDVLVSDLWLLKMIRQRFMAIVEHGE
jgi:hypothetical protein